MNPHEEGERAACGVQAVVRLRVHVAVRAIDDFGGDFQAAVGGQAVVEARAGGGVGHHLVVDGEALERDLALLLLGLLTHRRPTVGVHGDRAGHGLGRTVHLGDRARAEPVQPLELRVVGVVAERAAEGEAATEQHECFCERARDVVVVAHACSGCE